MVPDLIVNLVPAELTKPSVSGAKAEAIPVPDSAVPSFGAPALLIPDNFWSNLKQFLTERPVKVQNRPGAPFVSHRLARAFLIISRISSVRVPCLRGP